MTDILCPVLPVESLTRSGDRPTVAIAGHNVTPPVHIVEGLSRGHQCIVVPSDVAIPAPTAKAFGLPIDGDWYVTNGITVLPLAKGEFELPEGIRDEDGETETKYYLPKGASPGVPMGAILYIGYDASSLIGARRASRS